MKRSTLALLSIFLAAAAHAGNEGFPHRAKFSHVPIMELEQLHARLERVHVVDVRSGYEYETLRIKGAVHIPLSRERLPAAVRELRRQAPKPVVFYCNGITCKKSYEAAEIAIKAGIPDVYAYDAGLENWVQAYPEASVLLGRGAPRPQDLISKEQFKKRLISAEELDAKVAQNAVVLDIRDLRQRDVALFPFREERAPLDNETRIAEIVAMAKSSKRPLVVYDKVGKQTRWFQYYLERQGVKDYYFLEGGAEAYHEAKLGKSKVPLPDPS